MFVFSAPFPALAAVIHVPDDAPTIQSAINASSDGDEIIVSPGTYYENVNFDGKNITLRSTDPTSPTIVSSTIIDGNHAGSVVTFSGTELSTCTLSGITITNGYAGDGGGIQCHGALSTIQYNHITTNCADGWLWWHHGGGGLCDCDGTIQNNVISNNHSALGGGGLSLCDGMIQDNIIRDNMSYDGGGGLASCAGTIQNNVISGNSGGGALSRCNGVIRNNIISGNAGGGIESSDGIIEGNIISGNSAQYKGGGIYWCRGIIRNNTIQSNSAQQGGAIYGFDATIQNNIISGNSSVSGGGLEFCDGIILNNTICGNRADYGSGLCDCDGFIINCIVWANSDYTTDACQLDHCSTPFYCCIQDWTGGGRGNIAADPEFLASSNGNYHLQAGSPCIDAGNTFYLFGEYIADMDRACRQVGSSVDMGADEFGSSSDADGDLLSDADETAHGTDPHNRDTDGDGLTDGVEVLRGTNPVVANSPSGISIPSDYATVQQGLFLAFPLEEVTLDPSIYYENVNMLGKNLTLRSTNPVRDDIVDATILDGSALFAVVCFRGTENETAAIEGLTIRNGLGAFHGAAIRGYGTSATIQGNKITGNVTEIVGAVDGCNGTIEQNTISGNSGDGLSGCDGTILHNTISDNSASGLRFCDGTIQTNTISNNRGGGLLACYYGVIQDNIISGNSYAGNGGGLSACCLSTIQNNTISGNSARYGGGLALCDDSIIQNNTISDNSAVQDGGGLFECNYSTIQNNIISSNSAQVNGGGLFHGIATTFQNNVISDNSAYYGGGLCSLICGTIQNCTIIWNSAQYGGGLYDYSYRIANCIIAGNDNCGIYESEHSDTDEVKYCSIYANTNGDYYDFQTSAFYTGLSINDLPEVHDCISADPQLRDPANGDFHLKSTSPCIDAGCYVPDLTFDFEGDPRPWIATSEPRGDGSHFDIGADEFIRTHYSSWLLH